VSDNGADGFLGFAHKVPTNADIMVRGYFVVRPACRTRTGHAPENLATLRHIAVNLLKQEHSCNLGIKSKRLKAGWDESYMLKVLNI